MRSPEARETSDAFKTIPGDTFLVPVSAGYRTLLYIQTTE
jgi:hypothetical protein